MRDTKTIDTASAEARLKVEALLRDGYKVQWWGSDGKVCLTKTLPPVRIPLFHTPPTRKRLF